MDDTSKIIGKHATINCLKEQLELMGIGDLMPGTKVEIIEFDVCLPKYGNCYKVHDGTGPVEWSYIIPLKFLDIID